MSQARAITSKPPYVPLLTRFKAWWEGSDPLEYSALHNRGNKRLSVGGIEVDQPAVEEDVNRVWPEERLKLCRRLWGTEEDNEVVAPGGSEYSSRLVKPMGMNNTHSFLDLSAGLGGGSRRIAREIDLWVTGMECDPELANFAHQLSVKHGMERRVPVDHFDPATLELPERKFDGVLMRELLHKIEAKEHVLSKAVRSLKPRGHLVITDFVYLNSDSPRTKEVAVWLKTNQHDLPPWTLEYYKRQLTGLSMDIRIFEDATDDFRSMVLHQWKTFVDGLTRPDLNRQFVNVMMVEAQSWLRTVRALESGQLRYLRLHAMRGRDAV